MTEITQNELIQILKLINKSTFINLVTVTEVRMNKTGNPYHNQIVKLTRCNYLIGNDYEKRVNTNDLKEGGEGYFETKESSVGVHVSKCVLFNEGLNRFYLEYEKFDEVKPNVEYEFQGNSILKVLFENYMVKKSSTTRQPQERVVKFQAFKMSSIKEISIEKEKYKIV